LPIKNQDIRSKMIGGINMIDDGECNLDQYWLMVYITLTPICVKKCYIRSFAYLFFHSTQIENK
jgi:hypothetical protein